MDITKHDDWGTRDRSNGSQGEKHVNKRRKRETKMLLKHMKGEGDTGGEDTPEKQRTDMATSAK